MKLSRFGLLASVLLASFAFADVKIPDLPAGAALSGTDPIPTVQADVTVKTTPAAMSTYVESQLTSADVISKWGGTCSVANFLRGDGNCGLVALTSNVSGTLPVANGGTNLTAATDDQAMIGNGTTWQSKAIPNCGSSTQALAYDTSTNTFSCQTVTGSGGTPAGSTTQVQFNNAGAFGASAGMTYTQGSGGTGDILFLGRTGLESGRLSGTPGSGGNGNTLVIETPNGPATFSSGGIIYRTGAGGSTGGGSGDMAFSTGTPTSSGTSGEISFATGNSPSGTDGPIRLSTGGTERLEILGTGGWEVGGSQGTATHVLTSNGAGTPPTWQAAGGVAQTTGTFSATIATGCSTTPTVDFAWSKIGNIVTLKLTSNTISCTSNTTNHTQSTTGDLPAAIRPSSEVTFGSVPVLNSGNQSWGCISLSSNGTIIWELLQSNVCQNNGYTASGSRGVVGTGNQAGTTVYTYTIQ